MAENQSGLIDDPDYIKICKDVNHNPPTIICIPEGKIYRHVCPSCGVTIMFKSANAGYTMEDGTIIKTYTTQTPTGVCRPEPPAQPPAPPPNTGSMSSESLGKGLADMLGQTFKL